LEDLRTAGEKDWRALSGHRLSTTLRERERGQELGAKVLAHEISLSL
jgi:hypothetical protein